MGQAAPVTILASAQRTTAQTSADFPNKRCRGLILIVDVTDLHSVTPGLTVTIQGKDPVSGKYYTILASAAITTVSTTVLRVFPGGTIAANLVANDCIPETWRVTVAVADADACTYSIGGILVP